MRLDLGKIRTPHERFEQVYPPEAFAADPESFRIVAPVSLAFDVYKDGSQFRLAGHTKTTLELPCSRCLEPLTTPVDVAFDRFGHLYVLERGAVLVFAPRSGALLRKYAFLRTYAEPESSPGALRRATAFALDPLGRLYIADDHSENIRVYQ